MTSVQHLAQLKAQLSSCLIRDRHVLRRKLADAGERLKRQQNADKLVADIESAIARSAARVEARRASLPTPRFDEALPVNQKLDTIRDAIERHQVVIVCGETGSGKTTQIPKICLTLGRGAVGLIGHTQPRRLAARSVATRIAQELDSQLGEVVGYKVRFTDKLSERSAIKLMTDGILLAETQTDRHLEAYDTIIIDEAHERSLNIDFMLGYLKQLLPRRPDLKVIITSATIDADRFARHFDGAPVIEVSGRTFPVEIRYRPLAERDEDEREMEMEDAVVGAVDELSRLGAGDVLVFLPGEREIRVTAERLRKSGLRGYEILPLFARLSNEDQQRIFKPSGGRRIVLSTNVAETSLTVPGIRYVVDTGQARIKRYSPRAKVEQLQVEKISQAAARQRAGRCGRVEAGVCIRLYAEDDFEARAAFTDPEIVRSNLAAVILRMASLRLGHIDAFPFLEPPSSRLIADGYQILTELGAVDDKSALTPIGQELARIPVDPKIGRMLLAAREQGCVRETLILAAALSIQDPRERPFEARDAAERAHARFVDDKSDFLSFLALWDFFDDALRHKKSTRQLVNLCHEHFLSYMRMREWRELHGQLGEIAAEMGLIHRTALHADADAPKPDTVSPKKRQALDAIAYEHLHKALLTGLIGNVGMKSPESDDYTAARGSHFLIFPGSGLKKARPKWLVAAELVETSRLYARSVARIEPEWIEQLAPHLVKSHYFDPHWDKARGEVVASERVTLYGLTLVARRPVSYGRIAPDEARELFIRGALVMMEYASQAPFFQRNQRLIREIEQLEHKARRQDVLVDEDALFAFYAERIPAGIVDAASFESWRAEAERTEPERLFLTREELMRHAAQHVTENQFPEWIAHEDGRLRLRYRFEPGHVLDGVTVELPLAIINRLDPAPFEWLVPGMVREKLQALIKALPKQIRRACVPVPDFVTRFLSAAPDQNASLTQQLLAFVTRETGQKLDADAFAGTELPPHLRFNYRVVDDGRQEIGLGRDLVALQRQFGQAAQLTFRDTSAEFERDQVDSWDMGDLPPSIQFARGRQQLTGYPALALEEQGIALRLFDTEAAAQAAHRVGVVRLLSLQLKEHMKQLGRGLPGMTQIALQLRGVANADQLLADAIAAICDRAFIGEDALPRTEKQFNDQKARARTRLPAVTQAVTQYLTQIAAEYQALNGKLGRHKLGHELKGQLDALVYPGFLAATPWSQLPHLTRYMKAMSLRMDKQPANPQRDGQRGAEIRTLWQQWSERVAQEKERGEPAQALLDFRWLIEELRVSLFAQELKTPFPVSLKRLQKAWQDLPRS
jgi:ATP-dependent helicase HrpA